MLISVQSTDPESYNTVRTNFDIPWKCEYIKYYVSSINTNCNILMTAEGDIFQVEIDGKLETLLFPNIYSISIKSLLNILNDSCKKFLIWKYDNLNRVFQIKPLVDFILHEPSHRVALLLGLYNTKFPLEYEANKTYFFQDTPILYHSKFYLVSLQGNPMYSNIGEQQHTPSIIGNIDTITMDTKPIIYNFEKEGKPLKIKTYTESLKNLEISLVDFQFQPILLKSPLNLCVKIKPAKDVDVKDILTK